MTPIRSTCHRSASRACSATSRPSWASTTRRPLAGVRADAVVVGMPYDGIATFRGGATRRAPQEIRKYPLLFGGYNLDWDLDVFTHLTVVDAGDIDVLPGDTLESYARLERRIDQIAGMGSVPI